MTTGVASSTSVSFQLALLITFFRERSNYSSSDSSRSPLALSGVMNSTIGVFIWREEVARFMRRRSFVSRHRAVTYTWLSSSFE